jgi:hypothetical protein
MPSALEPMPQPSRTNRMGLLVFGTGAAIGLQLGMLHVLIWGFARALITFIPSALFFSGATYVLWRWLFPRLGGRSLGAQIAIQTVVTLIAFTVLSVATTEFVVSLLGGPSLFGAPTGPEKQLTFTPHDRQMGVWLYAVFPILPTALITLIGYHQYWSRVLALQHRERELTELAATAQLAALRAQINPHFLFNSLNSIAQLIRSDPTRPKRASSASRRSSATSSAARRRSSCRSARSCRWRPRTSTSSARGSASASTSRPRRSAEPATS